jgi:hypothetical protein
MHAVLETDALLVQHLVYYWLPDMGAKELVRLNLTSISRLSSPENVTGQHTLAALG